MNRYLLIPILAVALAGCASQQKKPTAAELKGSGAVLAGEWEMPANQSNYLFFKPEPGNSREGRFGGIADYDRYRIKGGLMFGGRITVELQSASADTATPTVDVVVFFAPDGKSLKFNGAGIRDRLYKRVQL